jgi:hypothetical protein
MNLLFGIFARMIKDTAYDLNSGGKALLTLNKLRKTYAEQKPLVKSQAHGIQKAVEDFQKNTKKPIEEIQKSGQAIDKQLNYLKDRKFFSFSNRK